MSDILLIGATGLVGSAVIAGAQACEITTLTRREITDMPSAHRQLVAPGECWADIVAAEQPRTLISCLGTTIGQAGSQAAFRAVDFDLLLSAATGAKLGGARHMICISSVGASANSGTFYLRTKGEAETALRALGFARLDIMRPGLLRGTRHGPARFGESLAMNAAPLTDALLHGSLRRYRSIAAATVADAILALAAGGAPGTYVHENDSMAALAD